MTRFLLATPLVLLLVTFLDGAWVAERFARGQWLADAITLAYWALLYRSAGARLRRLLVLGLLPATVGELLFSPGLGMYEYRLHAVPLYVPPGHTILYGSVFLFAHAPGTRRAARWLAPLLFALGGAYAYAWHRAVGDPYGLACWMLFAVLWLINRPARLFFAAMFLLVAWLEQCGTRAGAWAWPATLLGRIPVGSANPPGGIAVFYALFDLSCLGLYFFARWPSFERWISRRHPAPGPSPERGGGRSTLR